MRTTINSGTSMLSVSAAKVVTVKLAGGKVFCESSIARVMLNSPLCERRAEILNSLMAEPMAPL